MTSNLASDEIAQHAVMLRNEVTADSNNKGIYINGITWCLRFCLKNIIFIRTRKPGNRRQYCHIQKV